MQPFTWTTLRNLSPGMVFATEEGLLAVKSAYTRDGAPMCILVGTGEYARFGDGADTRVTAIDERTILLAEARE